MSQKTSPTAPHRGALRTDAHVPALRGRRTHGPGGTAPVAGATHEAAAIASTATWNGCFVIIARYSFPLATSALPQLSCSLKLSWGSVTNDQPIEGISTMPMIDAFIPQGALLPDAEKELVRKV